MRNPTAKTVLTMETRQQSFGGQQGEQMFRFWLVTPLALLAVLPLSAQLPPEQSGNVYELAFRVAAEAQAKKFGYQRDRDYYNLIVEKDRTTEGIPGQVMPFRVSVLDSYGLRDRFKKQGKFPVLEIFLLKSRDPS